jgi:hypothetical protein
LCDLAELARVKRVNFPKAFAHEEPSAYLRNEVIEWSATYAVGTFGHPDRR